MLTEGCSFEEAILEILDILEEMEVK